MVKKRLRIAMIAPLSERVPPKKYGGTERVVHALTEELVARGHDVTLFASGDSHTGAQLSWVFPRSLREAKIKDPYGLNELVILHLGIAYKRQHDFDVIHDHNHLFSLPTAQLAHIPVVMTIHGPITPQNRRLYETFNRPAYVTISESQRHPVPNLPILKTVYNGLPMKQYPFGSSHQGYLLCVGRLSMEKGMHHAIEVAVYLDLPLIIAAKLDSVDQQYFDEYIRPRLSDDRIRWIGEVDEEERNRLMSNALCLLHPVLWREPFGLTMIESMACGCPVIAFNRGSIPEIIKDGVSGFVVSDVDEMIDAVSRTGTINRQACRTYALHHFSSTRMTDAYERIYYQLCNKQG